jgi:signal transduction histidine kinase
VFLDVPRRHLAFLDPVARQLYDEGVPFTPADLTRHRLLKLGGQVVTAAELPLVAAWREGRAVEATFALPRQTGVEWRVTWNAAPVRNTRGEIAAVAGTIRCGPPEPDWQAMAGLAHDMRTPLNAITLQLAVLQHLAEANPDLGKVLNGIHSSAERALRVGMELLNWCRGPGQKGRKLEPAWFLLEPLLEELAREQGLSAKGKGLVLSTDFNACQGWEINTDRVRLARILSNLLVNAVRYTPRGRVEFTAAWRDEPKGRMLALSVADTGVGITTEEQESIFQPFERGRAGKEGDSGGSGLGLAVVDRLVEELGVDLEVFSQHGHGSEFHLLLGPDLLRQAGKDETHTTPDETLRHPQ